MNQVFKTLIIDDEPLARLRLQNLLAEYPETFEIIGEASNGKEALEEIDKRNPDLLFLDIQMPEMNGFEMLQNLSSFPRIIFCTAFEEYALQAFDSHCIDYLVKPITKERFKKTVQKLRQFGGKETELNINGLIEQLKGVQNKSEPTSIPVKSGDKVFFIRLSDVSFFKADEKYVSLVTKHAKEHIIDSSLKKLEEKIPEYFIRVHKSYIINKNLLKEIRKHFNTRYVLIMDDYTQTKITSGRSYYSTIKQLFEL